MGEMKNAYKILVRKLEGNNHSKDKGVNGRKILEWSLGKWRGKLWTG